MFIDKKGNMLKKLLNAVSKGTLTIGAQYDAITTLKPILKYEIKLGQINTADINVGQLLLEYLVNVIVRCYKLHCIQYKALIGDINEYDLDTIAIEAKQCLMGSRLDPSIVNDMSHLIENELGSIIVTYFDDLERELYSKLKNSEREMSIEYSIQFDNMRNTLGSLINQAAYDEWNENIGKYDGILQVKNMAPNTEVLASEKRWRKYYSYFLHEYYNRPMMDTEHYSLADFYIPLACYKFADRMDSVYELDNELLLWAKEGKGIKLLLGGPGYGKSTVLKHFAAELIKRGRKVLYVQLKDIAVSTKILNDIAFFIESHADIDGFSASDIKRFKDEKIILCLDGLDEMTSINGNASTAISELIKSLKVNAFLEEDSFIKIILSGREEISSCLDKSISDKSLRLLPYRFDNPYNGDPLFRDRRRDWWDNYHALYPNSDITFDLIQRYESLNELSAIPVLNYLIAISFHSENDLSGIKKSNQIYEQLVKSVYEKSWGRFEKHPAVSKISEDEFFEIYEEAGFLAWSNGGKAFMKGELDHHLAHNDKLKTIFDKMSLLNNTSHSEYNPILLCFYIERSAKQADLFEFVHRTFWEYLLCRKLVRSLKQCMGKDCEYGKVQFINTFGRSYLNENMWNMITNEFYMLKKREAKWHIFHNNSEEERLLITLVKLLDSVGADNWDFDNSIMSNAKFEIKGKKANLLNKYLINLIGNLSEQICSQWIPVMAMADMRNIIVNALQCNDKRPICLSGMIFKLDCSGLSLAEAHFIHTDIAGSDFRHAQLQGADFENARLCNSFFNMSFLQGVNFRNANLYNAILCNASILKKSNNINALTNKQLKLILTGAELKGLCAHHFDCKTELVEISEGQEKAWNRALTRIYRDPSDVDSYEISNNSAKTWHSIDTSADN